MKLTTKERAAIGALEELVTELTGLAEARLVAREGIDMAIARAKSHIKAIQSVALFETQEGVRK